MSQVTGSSSHCHSSCLKRRAAFTSAISIITVACLQATSTRAELVLMLVRDGRIVEHSVVQLNTDGSRRPWIIVE